MIASFMEIQTTNLYLVKKQFVPFSKHNLCLKAGKYSSGFKELEFVGKVVSEAGLKVSQEKIRSVLDFPLPTVGKQLKTFLGTVTYLRDFVRKTIK